MANITGDIDLSKWLNTMYADYQGQAAKKDTMFAQGVSTMQDYASMFKPGGSYGAGTEAMIARGGEKAVASGMQNLVSAGLSNTTMPMHLSQSFEEEVGMPTRLASRDRGMELYGNAMGNLGNMYANYDPVNPSGFGISSMATGGFNALMSGRIADINAQEQRRSREPAQSDMTAGWDLNGGGGGGGSGGGSTSTGTSSGAYQRTSGSFANPYGGGSRGSDDPAIMAGLFQADQLSGGLGTYGDVPLGEGGQTAYSQNAADNFMRSGGSLEGWAYDSNSRTYYHPSNPKYSKFA